MLRVRTKQLNRKKEKEKKSNFIKSKSFMGRKEGEKFSLPRARTDRIKITSDSSKCKALNLSSLLYVVNPTVNR